MNISGFKNLVTSKVATTVFRAKHTSPHVLFATGVVGVVAAGVMASRATLKMNDVFDERDQNLELAKRALASEGSPELKTYDVKAYERDVAVIQVKSVVNVVKLYAPAVVVGGVSIGLLTGAHVVLNRRNVALTAAYAAVDKAFNEYRKRVVTDLGAEKDREYRYGVEKREVIVEDKKGGHKVKTVESFGAGAGHSMYARLWGKTTASDWSPEPSYNVVYLRGVQRSCTQKLQAQGHLMLNDVYDALGLARTAPGAVVGWIYDPNRTDGHDNFVSFGIFEGDPCDDERVADFFTGREQEILLDFNVQGTMWDKI